MYLTCPSCDSRFQVAIEQLGPKGRRVRCGRCGHAWRAQAAGEESPASEPETAAAEAAAAETTQPDSAPTAEATGTAPSEDPQTHDPATRLEAFDEARRRSRAERRRPPPAETKKKSGGVGGWIFFVAVVVALLAGAVMGRQQVVAWLPATAELYAKAGLPVESPLEILDATSELLDLDGEESLVVAGRIVNPTDAAQPVPPIVATVLGPEGSQLKRWTFAADLDRLPPGGSTTFKTTTPVPPPKSRLNLDFSMEN